LYSLYPSPASAAAAPNDGMPFLEEALGKPLGRLAAMSMQWDHPSGGRRGGDTSRNDGGNGCSGGLDFGNMYRRLVRFRQDRS
jgi:hypothetical protein